MTHIDEGTIHAWLDDALPPDEAARVEAHVRDCAECSAAVAEARGFIAASSRILAALDEVPGGVIPRREGDASGENLPVAKLEVVKSEMVNPEVVQPEVVQRGATRARRRWWQRPQFAAAAGIAFIAVAASVVARRGGIKSVTEYSMERAPANEAPRAATPAAQGAPAAPGASASQRVAAKTVPSSAIATQGVSAERRAGATPPAPSPAPRESTVADAAVRGVATALPAAGDRAPKAAVAAAPQAAVAGGTARPADSTAAKRALAVSPDAITRAEKARVLGERNVQLEAVVTTGAAETRTAPRRDVTTVQGIVGCYRLQRRVPALDAGVTEIVALEGTETGRYEGDVLRSARLIDARPEANTRWHWTFSPRGDVALVREQAGAYARFPLALRMAAQTGETSIATRIDCPAR